MQFKNLPKSDLWIIQCTNNAGMKLLITQLGTRFKQQVIARPRTLRRSHRVTRPSSSRRTRTVLDLLKLSLCRSQFKVMYQDSASSIFAAEASPRAVDYIAAMPSLAKVTEFAECDTPKTVAGTWRNSY